MWCSFKYVLVRSPIFTYLLGRAFSQTKNRTFLKKTPSWKDEPEFCSAPLVVIGDYYQLNPPR